MGLPVPAARALAAAALIAAPTLAAAQGLYGSTVVGSLLYPTAGSVAVGPIAAAVGPAVEFPAGAFVTGRNFSIDIGKHQLDYMAGESTTYAAADYNGFGFVFSGAPEIVAVSLHGASTFAPVSFAWTANSLSFDLAGRPVNPADRLVFSVSVVPELPTAWLLLAGALATSSVAWRRRTAPHSGR